MPYPKVLSPSHNNRVPQLPFELIWIIIEQALADLTIISCGELKVTSPPIPLYLLLLNRRIYALVVKLAYRTITISSSRSLARFLSVVTHSPHLSNLVHNLWIGTSNLEAFPHQVGWAPCVIARILSKSPRLKRVALPAAFFPPNFVMFGSAIEHITFGGGSVPGLPLEAQTVHVYGLVQPSWVRRLAKGALRRVVCDLRRPCALGAIENVIQELFDDKALRKDNGFQVELIVPEGLETWLRTEMSSIGELEDRYCGSLVVRVEGGRDNTNYYDMWVGAIRG